MQIKGNIKHREKVGHEKENVSNKDFVGLALVAFLVAGEGGQLLANPLDSPTQETPKHTQQNNSNIATTDIGELEATGKSEINEYQSGSVVDRHIIESTSSGNGDISSVLKMLPNVSTTNASRTSNMPGEINPASISISGGLPYQNNFTLDGFEMNNDIDPVGSNDTVQHSVRAGFAQGLNIDSSLLDSITVLDSNISAKYGRFSGGVIESSIRKPRADGWHGSVSYQYTSSAFTKYYIVEGKEDQLANSSNENYQPNFTKHLIRANVEGYIDKNIGLIAAFSTSRVKIPLQAYISNGETQSKDQRRTSENFLVKLHYNPSENFTLEYHLTYAPQDNTYFTPTMNNSFYTMKSGGIQTGLKALQYTTLGLWTTTLGYSWLQNSRKSEANYRKMPNREGQWGSLSQKQDTTTLKSDFAFSTIESGLLKQHFLVGLEAMYQNAQSHRPESTRVIFGCTTAAGTAGFVDNWGINTSNCGNSALFFQEHKLNFSALSYALYTEDNANFDLGRGGEFNARLGVRLDGDNYFQKHTFAPRFSLNYITPASQEWRTKLTFGANRYYGRNLIGYKYRAIMWDSQMNHSRANVNSPWLPTTGTSSVFGTNTYRNTDFSSLSVPYDDELMGALTQNIGIFSATLKYIYRNGKDQITQREVLNAAGDSVAYRLWTNNGGSKADIISLEIGNKEAIETGNLAHYYSIIVEYNDTKRTYNAFSAYENLIDNIAYNGEVMAYQDMPVQIYKQPFLLRVNTTHSFTLGRTKWLWNNFFRLRGKYEKIVLESQSAGGTCSAGNLASCNNYTKRSFSNAFMWDMRLGFDVDVYRGNTLFVNVDVYNVLNSKNLTTIGLENGVLLTGVPSSAGILTYELGRQFWVQVGYKF